jgi:hypothetical protein
MNVIIIGTVIIEMQFILRNRGPRLRWGIVVALTPRFSVMGNIKSISEIHSTT